MASAQRDCHAVARVPAHRRDVALVAEAEPRHVGHGTGLVARDASTDSDHAEPSERASSACLLGAPDYVHLGCEISG